MNELMAIEADFIKAIVEPKKLIINTASYEILKGNLENYFHEQFAKNSDLNKKIITIPLIGNLQWAVESYGKLDSSCFFGIIEYLVWLTYKYPRSYEKIWDVGAHTGIDTIVMAKFSEEIVSFEPELNSYKKLQDNVKINSTKKHKLINAGLSYENGKLEFIVVNGNTTANHIAGSREHHGEIEKISVDMVSYKDYKIPDYLKINIEGYEKELIPRIENLFFKNTSAIIEIHSAECMKVVHEYAKINNLKIYSQMLGFGRTNDLSDMPKDNKMGYVVMSPEVKENWFL
jgi:FkbM family methyltransferase